MAVLQRRSEHPHAPVPPRTTPGERPPAEPENSPSDGVPDSADRAPGTGREVPWPLFAVPLDLDAEPGRLDVRMAERHPLDSPTAVAAPVESPVTATALHVVPITPADHADADPAPEFETRAERRRHARRAARGGVVARRTTTVRAAPIPGGADREPATDTGPDSPRVPLVALETLGWSAFGALVAFAMITASGTGPAGAALWAAGLAGVVAVALGLVAATGTRLDHLHRRPSEPTDPDRAHGLG